MRKYIKKELKNMLELGLAVDITTLSSKEIENIYNKEQHIEQVGYCSGVYGVSGCLLKGYKTGTYYVITARNSNLFRFV